MNHEQTAAAFAVSTEVKGSAASASLRGELDIAAVCTLERALAELEAAQPTRLVLDLRRLTFMDAMGLGVILAANERAQENGFDLALVPAEEAVQRVFSITKTAGKLQFVKPDTEELASTAG